MAKTRTTKNSSLKNSIVKSNLKTSLKTPPGYAAQLTTPTKDYSTAIIITPDKCPIEARKVDNLTSLIDLSPQQTSKNNHSNPTPSTNSPIVNPASSVGKRSSPWVDPFATFVDV